MPVNDELIINYEFKNRIDGSELILMDQLGRVFITTQVSGQKGTLRLDFEDYSHGVYLLALLNGDGSILLTKKILKL